MANDEQWKAFEIEVETWFSEFGVKTLHTKDLHNTDGEFAGWTVLRKQAFVARLCQAASHHLQMAVSMSAVKSIYDERARESDRKRTTRPYSFCFNVILDWILRGISTGREANTDGLAFVLEHGHENNPAAEETFYDGQLHKLENVLRSGASPSTSAAISFRLIEVKARPLAGNMLL